MLNPAPREMALLASLSDLALFRRDEKLRSVLKIAELSEVDSIIEQYRREMRPARPLEGACAPASVMRLQAELALTNRASCLASLADGRRQEAFAAGCAVAAYVAHGCLSEGRVQDELLQAWHACGGSDAHGEEFGRASIRNGLAQGKDDDPPKPWACWRSDTGQRLRDKIGVNDTRTRNLIQRHLDDLAQRTEQDAGAPLEPAMIEVLSTLMDVDPSEFERQRPKLRRAGCRVAALDDALMRHRKRKDEAAGSSDGDSLADKIMLRFELFHPPDKEPYALDKNGSRSEAIPILSEKMRRLVGKAVYDETGDAPGKDFVNSLVALMAARAEHEGPEEQVHLRVARFGDTIYIDTADQDGTAIEVNLTLLGHLDDRCHIPRDSR